MPFPVTYLLDHFAPSETFIQREIDQLRRRGWPIHARQLKGGAHPLKFSPAACPHGFHRRFLKAACSRVFEELPREPGAACRIIRRLPQAALLLSLLTDTDSRLLHAHFAGIAADLASIVAKAAGIPWTCSVHAHDVFTAQPALLRRRLRTAAGIAACSQQAADTVIAAGIAPEKVAVIHHGIPLNDFIYDTIQPDDTIFAAGRLESKKGFDTLVDACALLVQRGKAFTCFIAGTGTLMDALKQQITQLDLEETVYLIDWQSQEEIQSHMMDATVFVLPSRRDRNGDRDGIANVLLEAMALGTPVISTAAGAAAEVIDDHRNGLLVPPDNPAALADALAEVLASKDLSHRFTKAARQTVETRFDASKTICEFEAFLNRAIV